MSICATGMLFVPSDSMSEQLQPAALLCILVSSKGLGPSAESHLPSAFISPSVGWQVRLAVYDNGPCCILLGIAQPLLLEWFWQHSEKLQSPTIFGADSSQMPLQIGTNSPNVTEQAKYCRTWVLACACWTDLKICGFIPYSDLNISKYLNVLLSYLNVWIRNESKLLRLQLSTSLQCTLLSMALLEFVEQMLVPLMLYCL